MMYFKTYETLPEDAVFIRKSVFMEEQGFCDEFDGKDKDAKHIVLYNDENKAAAVCRCFFDEENGVCVVGRIAVLKEFRHKHYGSLILSEAQRQAKAEGIKEVRLAAQVQAAGFYRKQGFTAYGEEFLEEGCPHVWMYKKPDGERESK